MHMFRNEINMDNQINSLDHIQRVEAPPYLYTRISQRIRNNHSGKISPLLGWSLGITCALILLLNITVLSMYSNKQIEEKNLAKSMNLMPDNYLYK